MGKAHKTHDVTFRNGVNVAPLDGVPVAEEPIKAETVTAPIEPEPEAEAE